MSHPTPQRPLRTLRTTAAAAALGALAAVALLPANAAHAIDDPIPGPIEAGSVRVELKRVAANLTAPTALVPVPGSPNTMLLVDQTGYVYAIKNGKLNRKPVLDLSDRLVDLRENFDERGFLGLALHPGFADPDSPGHRKLYTYSSEPRKEDAADFSTANPIGHDHQSVVAEWQTRSDDSLRVDPGSRREIMRVDQPQFNHDGGELAFGPDGMLYIGFGDGGAGNDLGPGHVEGGNGQDPTNILGTIARIDPLGRSGKKSENGQYAIPADNPFTNTDDALDEIWAYGFRNPWRFGFDTETGQLIVADVGQNKIEEIDIVQRGGNYGWRIKEGTFFFDPEGDPMISKTAPDRSLPEMIDPVAQYDHEEGISITGGYVYRGEAIPELDGLYVFGDWKQFEFIPQPGDEKPKRKDLGGRLMYADLETGEIHDLVLGSDGRRIGDYVTAFGQDLDGEIYVLTNAKNGPAGNAGKVWKIVPAD